MSGAYDQALKLVWRSNAKRLARLVTGEPVGQVRLMPTEPHQVLRIPDLVGQVQGPHGPYLLHIEIESSPKANLPERMLAYNVALRFAPCGPIAVRSYVLLVGRGGRRRRAVPEELVVTYGADQILSCRWVVVDLAMMDPSTLASDPVLAALTPLARSPGEAELRLAVDTLHAQPVDERREGVGLLFILANKPHKALLRTILDIREVRMSIGYQDILQEGRQEGRQEGLREAVARLANRRFGPVAKQIVELLPRCEESDLNWLLDEIPTARTAAPLGAKLRRRLDERAAH